MVKRHLITTIIAAALLVVPASAEPLENDPAGFLRDRTPFAQSVGDIARDGFARKLICAEDGVAGGRLLLSPRQAEELGLDRGHGDWVEIGRFSNVRLEAQTWRVLHVTLRDDAERALRAMDGTVRIYGESVAVSVQSERHGQAGWARTYGRGEPLRPLARKRD